MAIIRGIDLNLKSFDRWSMLLHGDYNTFKTFLTGAFLAHAIREGKQALFWNVKGEDGFRTLGFFPEIDPKVHIWTLEDAQDIQQAMKELEASPVNALGIDSGKVWADKVRLLFTGGEDRPLRVPKSKGEHNTEWPDMHHKMEMLLTTIRECAEQVIMTCPSDLSAHHLDPSTDTWKKERRVTPNFPGNEASRSTGWFDFVGYCQNEAITSGVRRQLNFQYNTDFATRARVIRQFELPIRLPSVEKDGHAVWEAVKKEIEGRIK